jgi:predicted nucleic acid-binding protein
MAATYLDSSAIVKLAVTEAESAALRARLRKRSDLVSSALARTEVLRALLALGDAGATAGAEALARVDLVRVNDRVLRRAAALLPVELRSLDAIHLATAQVIGDIKEVITYDERMLVAAKALGFKVAAPA